ncbi:hypothetical protein GCM10010211_80780 [Streptomyces albospinus]|uniref:Thioesterase family protein n=1 Tax=Streptomyces albospinus TaxID=285515 RepID=A0ABQ2VRI1_9ACTN|nr:thioesterase family protein [Streptomyces albospinus]GGV01352.1 hypothetical protein GCM10010211_80780 [Streptomyces albospinus]
MATWTNGDIDLPPLNPSWWSWHSAHGGLLAAIALRHAARRTRSMLPRSLHASFLTPVTTGALRLSAETEQRNLSSVVIRSTMRQDGVPAVSVTSLFGDSDDARIERYREHRYPRIPPVEDCTPLKLPEDLVRFGQHLEIRMAPGVRALEGGDDARLSAWIRLKDLELEPAEAAVVLLDSMPPALYGVLEQPLPIPSAEISVRFTDRIAERGLDGWALIEVRTEQADAGWTLESGRLWTPDGALMGVSLQTRRIVDPTEERREPVLHGALEAAVGA